MTYTYCCVYSPGDGQRNCPKHVEFYSKNKFEKSVHLVGFIIRMCHTMYMDYFGSNMYVHMHVEIDKDQDHKITS
jgi:hypothetical protein